MGPYPNSMMSKEILYVFIGVWSGMAVIIPLVILIIGFWESRRNGDNRGFVGPLEDRIKEIRRNTTVQTVKKKRTKLRSHKKRNSQDGSIHSTISFDTDASGSANCCHICLEDFKPGDQVSSSKSNSCTHIFHEDCINAWLITHDECPVCRNQFLSTVDEHENEGEGE